jgi:hypothetical protein
MLNLLVNKNETFVKNVSIDTRGQADVMGRSNEGVCASKEDLTRIS